MIFLVNVFVFKVCDRRLEILISVPVMDFRTLIFAVGSDFRAAEVSDY